MYTVSPCAYEEWEGKERRGKERKGSTCATGEKDTLRGTRTHTFCFPGSCPNPVRLEETSQSPFSVDDDVSTLTYTTSSYSSQHLYGFISYKNHHWKKFMCSLSNNDALDNANGSRRWCTQVFKNGQ